MSLLSPFPPDQRHLEDESADADRPSEGATELTEDDPDEQPAVFSESLFADDEEAFDLINQAFDDPSIAVRNAAVHALYDLRSDRSSSFVTAFREGSAARGRRIAAAMADSGLADIEILNLASEDHDQAYNAFSLLFLMAKAGEVTLLIQAIEDNPIIEVRETLVRLLAQCGQMAILSAFCRLAVRQSVPPEVRSALMEAIHQIRSEHPAILPPSLGSGLIDRR